MRQGSALRRHPHAWKIGNVQAGAEQLQDEPCHVIRRSFARLERSSVCFMLPRTPECTVEWTAQIRQAPPERSSTVPVLPEAGAQPEPAAFVTNSCPERCIARNLQLPVERGAKLPEPSRTRSFDDQFLLSLRCWSLLRDPRRRRPPQVCLQPLRPHPL